MIEKVDTLFIRFRSVPFFLRLTLFTRILLAAGFLPTGLVKLLGHRFTSLPVDTPVGEFFEAMYRTGPYWRFLGASQMLAAVLLLVPRWAHLGALLFVGVIVNIFAITVSMGFGGTSYVVGLMLLAVVYLCVWDYHRIRGLFTEHPWSAPPVPRLRLDPLERIGFWVFAVGLIAVFCATRNFVPPASLVAFLLVGASGGCLALARFLTVGRKLVNGVRMGSLTV